MTPAETPLRRLARRHAEGVLPEAEYRRRRRSFLAALEAGDARPPFTDWQDEPQSASDWRDATLRLDLTDSPPPPARRVRGRLALGLLLLALAVAAALLVADAGAAAPLPPVSSLAP